MTDNAALVDEKTSTLTEILENFTVKIGKEWFDDSARMDNLHTILNTKLTNVYSTTEDLNIVVVDFVSIVCYNNLLDGQFLGMFEMEYATNPDTFLDWFIKDGIDYIGKTSFFTIDEINKSKFIIFDTITSCIDIIKVVFEDCIICIKSNKDPDNCILKFNMFINMIYAFIKTAINIANYYLGSRKESNNG